MTTTMTTLKKHFVYQADYQHWANDTLFAALDVLDEDARQSHQGMIFENIHKTVNHILVATRNWMTRLKQDNQSVGREELFMADWKELKNVLRLEFREAQRWLEAQPEAFFDEQIGYFDTDNQPRQIWVRDALTHIMTHAAHLRGQVTSVAVRLGAPVPEMDYIFYKAEMEKNLEHLRAH
ncbi:damage-inducible protein DinB [Sulfurimicrobium lacus]|uniref:Damage-inducible protein DinB n=1 Tax=Sulfurimicrobium lacus TaxID=2715678 RepID=A0A6F8VA30_9PROT|nr:DinB family protein [Sulfurimicrobium lacus]BCB25615.1 damage-inducible protein DinB [Sulfurimicrobium lacus]